MSSILIIQTAFLGDAILSTSLVEEIVKQFPDAKIHVVTRKGHESLFEFHPHVAKVWGWDKQGGIRKYVQLIKLIIHLRRVGKFSYIFNLQRFFSTGFLAYFVHSDVRVGFSQNPWSWSYHFKKKFEIRSLNEEGKPKHDVQRNFELLRLVNKDIKYKSAEELKPKIFFGHPSLNSNHQEAQKKYLIIAPASVWKTKEWPEEKWVELIQWFCTHPSYQDDVIYIIGGKGDVSKANRIRNQLPESVQSKIQVVAGKQNLLQSMLLMRNAKLVVANDSAPIHMASAMNVATWGIFCSTIPEFGFFPLADHSKVFEDKNLTCRPCGIHGKKTCPLVHFKCAYDLKIV
ncbi:MAG: glycosyltransferase family 9 protein [Bacteriovoracaceae bacterium]|nr:glycosyltransferase family 9 protein [Bacteriovoracaceae bacterium]